MTSRQFAAVAAVGVFVLAGAAFGSQRLRADDDEGDDARVAQGLRIAPVSLNLHGKDRELVGLGSYLVNGAGDCNGCHSAGPQSEFTATGKRRNGNLGPDSVGRCRTGDHCEERSNRG